MVFWTNGISFEISDENKEKEKIIDWKIIEL
jgi:hypothetical protein